VKEGWSNSFRAKCSESFVYNRRKLHPDFALLQEKFIAWINSFEDFSRKLLSKGMVSVEVVFIVVWAARGYILVGREDDLIVWVVPMSMKRVR
jgi:hypothetical protein